FCDTAGLRPATDDAIEAIGMARARAVADRADLVLWLGPEGRGPDGAWEIAAQIDRADRTGADGKCDARHRLSALTGEGMDNLRADLVAAARAAMPRPGEAALNARQRRLLAAAADALAEGGSVRDPLILAE